MAGNNEEQRTKNKEHASRVLFIRVTTDEWRACHASAKESNLSLQSWTRRQLGLESRRGYPYRLGNEPRTKNEEPETPPVTRMLTDEPPTASPIAESRQT